jgi:hypothetical protein
MKWLIDFCKNYINCTYNDRKNPKANVNKFISNDQCVWGTMFWSSTWARLLPLQLGFHSQNYSKVPNRFRLISDFWTNNFASSCTLTLSNCSWCTWQMEIWLSLRWVMQYSTVQYSTVRYGTVRYGTVRHGTARHGTARHGTVQYSTAQRIESHLGLSLVNAWNPACTKSNVNTSDNLRMFPNTPSLVWMSFNLMDYLTNSHRMVHL